MASERNQDTAAAWRFHNATKYVGPAGLRDYADAEILMGEPPHLVQAMGKQDPAIEPLPSTQMTIGPRDDAPTSSYSSSSPST